MEKLWQEALSEIIDLCTLDLPKTRSEMERRLWDAFYEGQCYEADLNILDLCEIDEVGEEDYLLYAEEMNGVEV